MRAKKEFGQLEVVLLLPYGQVRVSFFETAGQDPKWAGLCYPHMTEVLICFNEPWSQGDRIYVLILGSHMTGVLVCCNEPSSQGKRLHLLRFSPQMTRVLICFNEPGRQHSLVRIST